MPPGPALDGAGSELDTGGAASRNANRARYDRGVAYVKFYCARDSCGGPALGIAAETVRAPRRFGVRRLVTRVSVSVPGARPSACA